MKKRWFYILFFLGILILFGFEISFGNSNITWTEIKQFFTGEMDSDSGNFSIILNLRFPRALTALIVGSSLSLAGLLMQTFFRNPLAGPSILGVSSGASLGVAFVTLVAGQQMYYGLGERLTIFIAALIGAISVLMVIIGVSKYIKQTVTLLIVGLMISYLTSSLVSVMQFNATQSSVKAFAVWGMGTFADVDWTIFWFLLISLLVSLVLLMFVFKHLNVLLLGERYAKSMGVNTKNVKLIIILISGIIVAVSTAFCGPIAFVGLAVPHLARGIFKTGDHRITVPSVLLLGGFLGLAADFISRMPWTEGGLPLNTVTAIVGAPVVIVYILKNR